MRISHNYKRNKNSISSKTSQPNPIRYYSGMNKVIYQNTSRETGMKETRNMDMHLKKYPDSEEIKENYKFVLTKKFCHLCALCNSQGNY